MEKSKKKSKKNQKPKKTSSFITIWLLILVEVTSRADDRVVQKLEFELALL